MDDVIHINEDSLYNEPQNLNDSGGELPPMLQIDNNDLQDDEDDEIQLDKADCHLPRPPTVPNVPIGDRTICPVCTEKGTHSQRIYIYIYIYIYIIINNK